MDSIAVGHECREWYRFGKRFEETKTKMMTPEIQKKLTKTQKTLLKNFAMETKLNVHSKYFSIELFITAIAYIEVIIEIIEEEKDTNQLNKQYTDFMRKEQKIIRREVKESSGRLLEEVI